MAKVGLDEKVTLQVTTWSSGTGHGLLRTRLPKFYEQVPASMIVGGMKATTTTAKSKKTMALDTMNLTNTKPVSWTLIGTISYTAVATQILGNSTHPSP